MAPRWVASSGWHGVPVADQVWAIAHASFSVRLPGESVDDGRVWFFIGPAGPGVTGSVEVLVNVYEDDRAAVVFHAKSAVPGPIRAWSGRRLTREERAFAARAVRFTDPGLVVSAPVDEVMGAAAAERGLGLLLAEYGSQAALDAVMQTAARRRPGDQPDLDSPSVHGRIAEEERSALDTLIAQTGESEDDLIRQAVRLLLDSRAPAHCRHRTAA